MSEEYYEEEGQELSAEELFQQRQAELEERFEEKGFFKRIGIMLVGLGKPHNTREYKEAVTELQRLKAPIIAVLLPVVGVISLIVITAVQSQISNVMQIEIASNTADADALEEETEEIEPEQELDMTQDTEVSIDVPTDAPTPMMDPAPPSPSPGGEPDKVSAAPSPVTCNAVVGTIKPRGLGAGDGGGFGTIIGGKGGGQNIDGCLVGIICDLKRDANGKANGYTKNGAWERLKALSQQKFSTSAMNKYLVAPKKVALNKVYIPAIQATEGPKAFGLNDCGDTGWMAFYTGDLKVDKKMRFRFVGYFDEFVVIRVGGKVVLEAEWLPGTPQTGGDGPGKITGWVPQDKGMIGKHVSWQKGAKMVYGDWINAEPGKPLKIELALGETAGGACGGLLCVQVEGQQYPEVSCEFGKHLQLPVFSSRKLAMSERSKIEAQATNATGSGIFRVPPYKFTVQTPNFNAKGKSSAKAASKNDVSVDVDI